LDLIVENTYLAVTYFDQEHEDLDHFSSFLEKYEIISKDMLAISGDRDDVFTFNPFFAKDNDEMLFLPVVKLKVHDNAEREEFIFPMKIFLDSKNINNNKTEKHLKSSFANSASEKKDMSKINFKVLFVLNKLYHYTD
jgi:hypothetical protein